jgi:hypothetical protein
VVMSESELLWSARSCSSAAMHLFLFEQANPKSAASFDYRSC